MKNLEGRTAVVTGAASGIGLAMVRCFTRAGMRVAMADVERGALATAAREFDPAGVLPVVTDVSDARAVTELADRAQEAFGAVHLVCNNAGVFTGGLSWEAPQEDWDWVFGVNVQGVVNGLRTFVPRLLEQGEGHVVNTASMAGVTATPLTGVYNASKHAVVSLSETLYLELEAQDADVGVSVVCPEAVRTGIARAERNRPDGRRIPETALSKERQVVGQAITAAAEAGLDPAVIAERTLRAVEEGRFWVLAEDEFWRQACLNRLEGIRRQENPGFRAPEGYED